MVTAVHRLTYRLVFPPRPFHDAPVVCKRGVTISPPTSNLVSPNLVYSPGCRVGGPQRHVCGVDGEPRESVWGNDWWSTREGNVPTKLTLDSPTYYRPALPIGLIVILTLRVPHLTLVILLTYWSFYLLLMKSAVAISYLDFLVTNKWHFYPIILYLYLIRWRQHVT